MAGQTQPLHVSLVAIPDAAISTLAGIYDVLGSFAMLAGWNHRSHPDRRSRWRSWQRSAETWRW